MNRNDPPAKAGLWELFLSFAKVGVMTFGGGYAMLPILQREIVETKHWATDEDLANYFAIGQCTPGVIAVNTATFIGHKTRGIPGGIIATLGVVFPSVVIISLLAGVIRVFEGNPIVAKAFTGIRACVCVLILNAVLKLWKSAVKEALTLGIFLLVLAAALFTGVSPVAVVAAVLAFAVVYEFVVGRRGGKEAD